MASMRDKYEAMLSQLKAFRDKAPRRLARLQLEWRAYAE